MVQYLHSSITYTFYTLCFLQLIIKFLQVDKCNLTFASYVELDWIERNELVITCFTLGSNECHQLKPNIAILEELQNLPVSYNYTTGGSLAKF